MVVAGDGPVPRLDRCWVSILQGGLGMRRRRSLLLLVAVVTAMAGVISTAGPASALTNTCSSGMYPNLPAGQSALKVACTAIAPLNSAVTINDFGDAMWHWGAAHTVTGTVGASGTFAINAVVGTVTTAVDANHSIECATAAPCGVPPGDFIKTAAGGVITVAKALGAGGGAGKLLTIGNGTNRAVSDGMIVAGGIVTSNTANFTAGDVGKTIGGGTLPDGATITVFTNNTTVHYSGAASAAGGPFVITIAGANPVTSTREVNDAVYTAAGTICSPTAGFAASDKELPVTGGHTITATGACAGGTSATVVPANLVVSAAKHVIDVGLPTKTAPTSGETAGALGAELTLSPSVSATAPPCAANKITAFSIPSEIYNPTQYATTALQLQLGTGGLNFATTSQPGTTEFEVSLQTTSVAFSAWVIQVGTGALLASPYTWRVAFPFLPTGLGACPNTNSGSTFGFAAAAQNQQLLPSGTGPASTSQMRALRDESVAGTHTYTAKVYYGAYPPGTLVGTTNCGVVEPRTIVFPFPCGNG
jgi:hypothetical protein